MYGNEKKEVAVAGESMKFMCVEQRAGAGLEFVRQEGRCLCVAIIDRASRRSSRRIYRVAHTLVTPVQPMPLETEHVPVQRDFDII